jgi:hypothetical protein
MSIQYADLLEFTGVDKVPLLSLYLTAAINNT